MTADPLAVTEYCGNENCRLPLNAVGLCTRCDSFRTEIALTALVRNQPPFGVCGCGAAMDQHGCPHGH